MLKLSLLSFIDQVIYRKCRWVHSACGVKMKNRTEEQTNRKTDLSPQLDFNSDLKQSNGKPKVEKSFCFPSAVG